MSGWRVACAIAKKDFLVEARSRTALTSALLFVVLVQLIVVFSRDTGSVSLAAIAPGVLWITIALASLMVLNRTFALEQQERALEVILLAPISRTVLFWGKWLTNLLMISIVTAVAFPIWVLFFNVRIGTALLGVLALAFLTAAGLSAVGTLFGAMAARTRAGELLLPILLLPFMLPPVYFAATTTVRLLSDRPWHELWGAYRFLLVFDLGFLILATMLFPMVVDE